MANNESNENTFIQDFFNKVSFIHNLVISS